jgi:hypothetical protein
LLEWSRPLGVIEWILNWTCAVECCHFPQKNKTMSLGQVNLRAGSCRVLRCESDTIVNLRPICCSPLLFYRWFRNMCPFVAQGEGFFIPKSVERSATHGKLIVDQPVNFPTAFGTWRLITVLTRSQQWSLV